MKRPRPLLSGVMLLFVWGSGVPAVAGDERPTALLAQRLEEDRPSPLTPADKTGREHFQLKLATGYEQGDYGADGTTRIFVVPVTLRYLGEKWDLSATFSYLRVDAPGDVTFVAGQATPLDQNGRRRQVDDGFGDIVLKGRYYLLEDAGGASAVPSIIPLLRLKIPTAESPNLGTGEPDFGFGVEFDKTFGRSFVLFGDVTYTIIGEPAGQNFDNRPGASLGAGVRLTDVVTVSGMVDWRGAVSERQADPVDLLGFVTFKVAPTVSVSPYVSVGLTSGSADFGVGVELSYKFGRY